MTHKNVLFQFNHLSWTDLTPSDAGYFWKLISPLGDLLPLIWKKCVVVSGCHSKRGIVKNSEQHDVWRTHLHYINISTTYTNLLFKNWDYNWHTVRGTSYKCTGQWVSKIAYACINHTLFNIQNSPSHHRVFPVPFHHLWIEFTPQPRQPLFQFLSLELSYTCSRTSYKWHHNVHSLCAKFPSLSVVLFEVHPWCSMCCHFIFVRPGMIAIVISSFIRYWYLWYKLKQCGRNGLSS